MEWTDAGARAGASREWAYLSPVFNFTNQERRVTSLQRAALVNDPALYNTAIAARQRDGGGAETALGAMAHLLSKRGDSMASALTPDQKKIAASFGIPEAEFAQKSAKLAASGENPWALTDQQRKIAKTFGMPERRLASATARANRSPGLLRAHQEIDRAPSPGTVEWLHYRTRNPQHQRRGRCLTRRFFQPTRSDKWAREVTS